MVHLSNEPIDKQKLQALLEATYDGNESAKEVFFEMAYVIVRGTITKKCYFANKDDYEDAVSYVMLVVVRYVEAQKIDPSKNVFAYINQVAKTRLIDYRKALKKYNDHFFTVNFEANDEDDPTTWNDLV